MSNKPTPHPHAELIKAWADGAKIQMFNFRDKKWEDNDNPTWLGDKYRIKPEENEPWKPKEGERFYFIGMTGCVYSRCWGDSETDNDFYDFHNCFCSLEEAKHAVPRVKAALKGELKIPTPSDENFQLDGKPLTDIEKEAVRKFRAGIPFAEADCGTWRALSPGEDALIRALRDVKIGQVFTPEETVIVEGKNDTFGGIIANYAPVAFLAWNKRGKDLTVAALKQIKAEQKKNND